MKLLYSFLTIMVVSIIYFFALTINMISDGIEERKAKEIRDKQEYVCTQWQIEANACLKLIKKNRGIK